MTEPNTPTAAKHALEAGLDVVFQSSYPQHRPYLEAFQRGMIADSVVDAVRNIGAHAGDEVVQLYVRDILASLARPVQQLAGFARIHLAPGEAREVAFTLRREHLAMPDGELRPVVEPGTFRVQVGRSSKDIRLRGELTVR